jgi:8-oxo-dGTP pyrophosphatase MutT (NUDIX family)
MASFGAPTDPNDSPVRHIAQLDLRFEPKPWDFAESRRKEILAHFETLKRERPALFNGTVIMLHRYSIDGDTLRGGYLQTDFASFIAWRDWNFPDPTMRNCFAQAVLRASDGAYLMGVMGEHTANAGQIYFPAGTPDLSDVFDGRVDLAASVARELKEETGLDAAMFDIQPGWTAAFAGPRIALLQTFQSSETATALRDRIRAHLAAETEPELSDMRIVRGRRDLDDAMPPFIHAFIRQACPH